MKLFRDLAMGLGVVVAALVAFLAPRAVLTAVPGALFSVWHNISGSFYASFCRSGRHAKIA